MIIIFTSVTSTSSTFSYEARLTKRFIVGLFELRIFCILGDDYSIFPLIDQVGMILKHDNVIDRRCLIRI